MPESDDAATPTEEEMVQVVSLDAPHLQVYQHRAAILYGLNIVAVIGGRLCPTAEACDWCDDLRKRCQSRRLA